MSVIMKLFGVMVVASIVGLASCQLTFDNDQCQVLQPDEEDILENTNEFLYDVNPVGAEPKIREARNK
ncbi:hypothetical protein LSTR_LSTR016888, partial [Laodelphax striatellus]